MTYPRAIGFAYKRSSGARHSGQRQFLVQDPDGYLLRFAEPLGER
jgi:hypothetical protein